MSFKDVTHTLERMEMLEERMGIRIQGLMAFVDDEVYGGEHKLQVQGEIYSTSGGALSENLTIQIVAQNEKGQVVGVSTIFLFADSFGGYEAFSDSVYCKAFPTRVKIVPKR